MTHAGSWLGEGGQWLQGVSTCSLWFVVRQIMGALLAVIKTGWYAQACGKPVVSHLISGGL
jgi:hypothetical protein